MGDKFSSLIERPVKKTPAKTMREGRTNSVNPSTTTLYFCPLSPGSCNFKTDKAGMMYGTAAGHLKEDHMVTGAMMMISSIGTYKFRKAKVELEQKI